MNNLAYKNVWVALVRIIPKEGFLFNDLIDVNDEIDETKGQRNINTYVGAWANIIIVEKNITKAIELIPTGLNELNFKVDAIDKVENTQSLINDNELNIEILNDVNWIINTHYKFKIAGRIFPFYKDEFEANPY